MIAAAIFCAVSAAADAAPRSASKAMTLKRPHRSLHRSRDAVLNHAQFSRTCTAKERKFGAIGCHERVCVCILCAKNIFLCVRGEKVGVRDSGSLGRRAAAARGSKTSCAKRHAKSDSESPSGCTLSHLLGIIICSPLSPYLFSSSIDTALAHLHASLSSFAINFGSLTIISLSEAFALVRGSSCMRRVHVQRLPAAGHSLL